MVNLDDIRDAHSLIADAVHRTPVIRSATLARMSGVGRFELKCENLQKTGSFKVRGALNRVRRLDDEERSRGVVTVSAGNHAQALAWASREEGVRCTVVMPETAARSKVDASRGYGANVVQHGTSMDAFQRAQEIAENEGRIFIHPFDHAHTIAGTGTVSLELLEQATPDVVVIPVGGGGLISGMAIAIKESNPAVRVIGVEPETAAVMRPSLDAGRPLRLDNMRSIADGLAAPMAGQLNFEAVQRYVDDVVLVSDAEIARAMSLLLTRCKLVAEGAGAAATAAVLARRLALPPDANVVAMLSGGNVDFSVLSTLT